MDKNYTNYKRRPYYYNPKKPVKSFQDLEIYQKTLELSVFVANVIVENFNKKTKKSEVKIKIVNNLAACALNIPHLLAESHSCRFGTGTKCLDLLDEAMLQCNKAIVSLEQTRDICDTGVKWEDFDEQIKKYFYVRRKILNLQRVWKKYIQQNKENE